MTDIDLEFKIFELEERNKELITEYRWLWNEFCNIKKEITYDKPFEKY